MTFSEMDYARAVAAKTGRTLQEVVSGLTKLKSYIRGEVTLDFLAFVHNHIGLPQDWVLTE